MESNEKEEKLKYDMTRKKKEKGKKGFEKRSGNKLSRLIPFSKIKTCFDIVRERKLGIIELIFDNIICLSSWNIKQKSSR